MCHRPKLRKYWSHAIWSIETYQYEFTCCLSRTKQMINIYTKDPIPLKIEIPLHYSDFTKYHIWTPTQLDLNFYTCLDEGINLYLHYDIHEKAIGWDPLCEEPFLVKEFPLKYSWLPEEMDWTPLTIGIILFEWPKRIAYGIVYEAKGDKWNEIMIKKDIVDL